jgi:hypothetical protein
MMTGERRIHTEETSIMMLRFTAAAAASALILAPGMASAQAGGTQPSDSTRVASTARDYIEGWYRGDARRMESALHPELVKRIVRRDSATGRTAVGNQGASELVTATARGLGTRIPEDARRKEVQVLDIFGNAATARIRATGWVDYLQLVRVDGEWKILNVLWELDDGEAGR